MTFNSLAFLIFAAIFFMLWPLVRRHQQARWVAITVASFIFYGWWDWRFSLLLVANGLVDFYVGLGLERFPRARKMLLVTSITANVLTLAIFKYAGFFLENLNTIWMTVSQAIGIVSAQPIPVVHLVLPIGISFYTFHSMSYIIDVYRGAVKPTRHLFHFFAYLSMFPHLVAGPIIRGADVLPQLEHWHPPTPEGRWEGLRLIAHGFFKKVVVADNIAPIVNAAFLAMHPVASMPYWWVVVSLFAFQIYCDFSGYSDIARGLAKWMGYHFPLNFNHPYTSTSLREFWTRWHISLSTWFRDYVYIPLGGSKHGEWASHRNMALTMLISGFWHGASWLFIIWGALHALYLFVERVTRWPARLLAWPGGRVLALAVVLVQVWVAWVFFRATSLEQAWQIVTTMFSVHAWRMVPIEGMTTFAIAVIVVMALRELYEFFAPRMLEQRMHAAIASNRVTTRFLPVFEPIVLTGMLVACVFLRGPGSVFIYFQF